MDSTVLTGNKNEVILMRKTTKKRRHAMTKDEKVILQRDAELTYDTDRLGPASLLTQQSHVNASRMIMVNHNMPQRVSIKDPELPLVPTGFENALAEYNEMNEQLDGDFEIVAKFEKNPYNYVLIGYDAKRRLYTAWKRSPLKEHSEGFATRFDNKLIDSLEPGDVVQQGTYIQKSESFDRYMNYRYGKNLNTIYLISTKVHEDGIVLMNGAENMLNTFRSHTITIPLSDNEVLLNWYGNDKVYQGLPYVGEKTKGGYLAIIRQIDGAKAPYSLKKKRLQHIERGDRKYYQSGRVIDIDIRYNGPRNKLSDSVTNEQVLKLYDEQQAYYMELYQYMRHIVDYAPLEDYSYTDEFGIICMEAYDYVDSSASFADNNDAIFGNMQINVQVMEEEKCIVGTKLVGRYGNKGVISKIIPPEQSWHTEDGEPIHAVVAGLGIVGRMNQSQCNEHAINDLAHSAIVKMKETDDPDEKLKYVIQILKILNPDEAKDFKDYIKDMSKKEKIRYCERIERDGIVIVQPPVDNATVIDIERGYEKFPVSRKKIIFEDGSTSLRPVINAKMFFFRLKQDPVEKYSARSQGPVNPLTTNPAKSSRKKKHLDAYSDVPVRLGESEMEVLLTMVNHPAAIADFMAENSTSLEAKMALAVQNYLGRSDLAGTHNDAADFDLSLWDDIMYNGDLLDALSTDDPEELQMNLDELVEYKNKKFTQIDESPWVINGSKKNMEQIWAYLNELGIRIEIETETAPDGEWFED